jgi:hypothetical protein
MVQIPATVTMNRYEDAAAAYLGKEVKLIELLCREKLNVYRWRCRDGSKECWFVVRLGVPNPGLDIVDEEPEL